eukprot:scaffold680693_cov45-Prasinocladus_malaysianus.AAC.1
MEAWLDKRRVVNEVSRHFACNRIQRSEAQLVIVEREVDPKNGEEAALSRAGEELYEAIFKYYTKKQWDKYPEELDASVLMRIPVRTNKDDRYFTDPHQALPKDGYTRIFEN